MHALFHLSKLKSVTSPLDTLGQQRLEGWRFDPRQVNTAQIALY